MNGKSLTVALGATDITNIRNHSFSINGEFIEKANFDTAWTKLVAGHDVDITASIEGDLGSGQENGSAVLVSAGGTVVAGSRTATINVSQTLRSESHKGSRFPIRKSGKKKWSGSFDAVMDLSNTEHKALINAANDGTLLAIAIGPSTPVAGDFTMTGNAGVSVDVEAPDDDTSMMTINLTGHDALVKSVEGAVANNGVINILDELMAGTEFNYVITNEDAAIGDIETITFPMQAESVDITFDKNSIASISANLQLAAAPTITNKAA